LELPAGTRNREEESVLCAARELEEETGFVAATLTPLCRFHLSPGMTDERMHAFVATGLVPSSQRLEVDEAIRPIVLGVAEVLRMIDLGEIEDSKTIAVLLLAARRGVFEGKNG